MCHIDHMKKLAVAGIVVLIGIALLFFFPSCSNEKSVAHYTDSNCPNTCAYEFSNQISAHDQMLNSDVHAEFESTAQKIPPSNSDLTNTTLITSDSQSQHGKLNNTTFETDIVQGGNSIHQKHPVVTSESVESLPLSKTPSPICNSSQPVETAQDYIHRVLGENATLVIGDSRTPPTITFK